MIKSATRRSVRVASALLAIMIAIVAPVLVGVPSARADPPRQTNKMMLVMDSSGSMKEKLPAGGTRIDAAKSALDTVVDGLPDTQQVGLRVYGAKVFEKTDKGACTDSQRVVDLGTDNRDGLRAAVKKYKPYGETPTGYALQQAGQDLGTDGQRTIVLVSDGEPTCAPDPCEVAADLAKDGIKLKIEVVGLDVSGKARNVLQCIAKQGHGHYYDADDAADIGAALETVATRSLRPYELTGKPITGASSETDAPDIGTGDWVDQLGGVDHDRDDLFYTLRRSIPGSTFHVSAALMNHGDGDTYDGLTLELRNADGEDCGSDGQALEGTDGSIVSVSYRAPGYGIGKACADVDTVTLEVSRGVNHSGDGLEHKVPVEIRVIEEPPASNTDQLPPKLPEPAYQKINIGTPTKIIGGSSFGDATSIEPGSYRGTIVPGELQLFAVPVDWGQHLTARLHINKLVKKLSDEMGDYGPSLNVRLFSASRAPAENFTPSEPYGLPEPGGEDLHAVSFPVIYQARKLVEEREAAASLAGDFYIEVSLAADHGKKYELPYELAVDVAGKVQGKPVYAQSGSSSAPSSPAASASPSASPTYDATSSTPPAAPATPAAAESDGKPWPKIKLFGAIIGGIGVLVVAGGGTTFLVLRRRH